ncbi:hypothetical protein RHMOL_Rhmol08G0135100 [Rhododendron molle]|uniref:Uncharacterized protein n=1 Tax=Rhododendron molle TaxID=49168 RepID=A0ACC0MMW4_RHOML|nr:hypothetical protein RHMOL_Rhmol08G0135100 [Rhododendron molle]
MAATLGRPSQHNPNLSIGAVGLTPGSAGGLEGPDRIFVGGLSYYFTEDLVVTDIACAALNGIKMGDKILTVRRANQGTTQPKPEQENALLHAQQQIALQVFFEYVDVDSATKARQGLNGRKFDGNQVVAVFYPEKKFAEADYDC